MISLDFSLQPPSRRESETDFASVRVLSLHYRYFYGDATFVINEVDLSTRGGFLTLVDFAVELDRIATALLANDDSAQVYNFTESDDSISFRRKQEVIEVSSSYAPGVASAGPSELSIEARLFLLRVLNDLIVRHPELGRNPYVAGKLATRG